MTTSDVLAQVTHVFAAAFGVDETTITPHSKLEGPLALGGIDGADALQRLEDVYKILIPGDRLRNCATVQGLVDCVIQTISEEQRRLGTP